MTEKSNVSTTKNNKVRNMYKNEHITKLSERLEKVTSTTK